MRPDRRICLCDGSTMERQSIVHAREETGFTLIEVIVTIALVMVLIGAALSLVGSLYERKALDATEPLVSAAIRSAQTIAIANRWSVVVRVETRVHDGLSVTALDAFRLADDPAQDDSEPITHCDLPANVRLVDADLPMEIVDNDVLVRAGSFLDGLCFDPEKGKREGYVAIGPDGTLFALSGNSVRTNMAFAWSEKESAAEELLTLGVNPATGEVSPVAASERASPPEATAPARGIDGAVHGDWPGVYGRQGMVIANYYAGALHGNQAGAGGTELDYTKMYDYVNLPDYVASYEYLQGSGYEAVSSYGSGPWGDEVVLAELEGRSANSGLMRPDGSRVSSSVLAHHPKKLGVVFWLRDRRPHLLSVYGVENTLSGRRLRVTVVQLDDHGRPTGKSAALCTTASEYEKGAWLRFVVMGNVLVSCKCEGSGYTPNTFVSGFLFDDAL